MNPLQFAPSARLSLTSVVLLWGCLPVCRYTIRDIGFVDLRGSDHVLRLHVGKGQQRAAADALRELDPAAESNIQFEHVTDTGAARWGLLRVGRPELFLDGVEVSGVDFGAEAALERALGGETLTRISSDTLETFAFAVAVEGSDGAANEALHGLVREAEQRLLGVADQLPRRIEWPLRRVVIESDAREAERVLLWGLGLWGTDLKTGGLAPEATALALVYGRGKLAGPVLSGDRLELREVLEQLVLIGESCECDTQRAWTDEPRLPQRWTTAQRAAAVAALGFDPDSPMVKGEVARILARGPRETAERPAAGIESLLFGYQETHLVLDALAPPRGGTANTAAATPTDVRSAVRVVDAGEGDWGFADATEGATDDAAAPELSEAGTEEPVYPGDGFSAKWSLLALFASFAVVLVVAAALVLRTRGRER